MTRKLIVGNWKMNLDYSEAKSLIQDIAKNKEDYNEHAEIVVCPPMPYLSVFHELLKDNDWIKLGAQNSYSQNNGAFTGETSPSQLKSLGVEFVIVGHSERREVFGEENKILSKKIGALLKEGLTPIYCCGEQLQVRKSNVFKEFVMKQIEDVLFALNAEEISKVVIAYEPIWAIGTGQTASSKEAQEIHHLIRQRVGKNYGEKIANNLTILYGGSMKPENANELLAEKDIDGGLIGGASLKSETFSKISMSY